MVLTSLSVRPAMPSNTDHRPVGVELCEVFYLA